jgi:Zn-dependent protease with chaperone function
VSESSTPEQEPVPRAPGLASILAPLPYHRGIIDYLKTYEAELWKWFSSTTFREEYAATTRLELLKSCYRFAPADHADLHGLVADVRDRLGLRAPVNLYQSQNAAGMNAALCYIPGEVHLVLEGPIRTTLSVEELRAILAHELAHYLLWERQDGELLVADQMLSAMASHARAELSHVESVRLFRLYLEVHCDRAALAVSSDPLIAISSLIKVQTGLVDAQAESYLRQSEEIFGQAEIKTQGLTHPESFIRARALKLWADTGDAAHAEIARMIEGPLELGRLSLLAQRRLSEVTRRLLAHFLQPTWLQTEPLLAHARLFFTDLDPAGTEPGDPALKDELAGMSDSVQRYLGYLLLDLATVDRSLEEAPLAAAVRLSSELGFSDSFLALAGEELELPKRSLTRLKKDAIKIVADAAADGSAESR